VKSAQRTAPRHEEIDIKSSSPYDLDATAGSRSKWDLELRGL